MDFNPLISKFDHINSVIYLVIWNIYLVVTNVINKLFLSTGFFSQSQNESRIIICESPVKQTCMNDLPEDVFVEVLLRLPVKSLLRFKVVCKAWRSHISNPKFVRRHNVRTTTNPKNDYFIAQNKSPSSDQDQLCAININFLDRAISLNPPIDNFNVVGSCNGLLCLEYKLSNKRRNKQIYLWNPATRKKKELPRYTIDITENYYDYQVSLGFGFDFANSDYKVVRIVRKNKKDSLTNRVEVYSLIKNCWKEIEVKLMFEVRETYYPAFVKGSLFWRITWHTLISFDVQTENFCTISLPPETGCHGIFEFKGAVAFTHDVSSSEIIDIWTLDDDSCWIKELTIKRLLMKISSLNKGLELVGCLKTGEFVGRIFSDELVLYDSVTGEIKHNILLKMHTLRTYNYSESLVNLN